MPIGFRAGPAPAASYGDNQGGSFLIIGAPFMAPLLCLAVIVVFGINLWMQN